MKVLETATITGHHQREARLKTPLGAMAPRRRRHLAGFVLAFLALTMAVSYGASLSATLEQDNVTTGETITLQLVLEGGRPQADPVVPAVTNLTIQPAGSSSQTTIINGRFSSQILYAYAVTAQREGEYVIPPFRVMVNGQWLTSAPLKLRVAKFDPSVLAGLASMKLILPKTNLFLGETVTFNLELYVVAQQEGGLPQIEAAGFTLGKILGQRPAVVRMGDREYVRYPFTSYVTPARPGQLALGPARFTVRLPVRRDMYGRVGWRTLEVTAEPVLVTVMSLPATNQPPNFAGAVGRFSMSVSATPTNVAVGDPITVKIEIAGDTLLDSLRLTEQNNWQQFKVYPPTSKLENADALGMGGRKYFEQVVVPQTTEAQELPPFQFSFFDPAQRNYRTLAGPRFALIVRPSFSAQSITADPGTNTVDIVGIKLHFGVLTVTDRPLLQQAWFLALQGAPLLAWLGLLLRRRRLEHLAANPRLRRQREAARAIEAGLRQLPKLAAARQTEQFFTTIFRLFQEQLGERLDLPAAAITEAVIEERLRPLGVKEENLAKLQDLFQTCNAAR